MSGACFTEYRLDGVIMLFIIFQRWANIIRISEILLDPPRRITQPPAAALIGRVSKIK